jgi:Domain of unknown function (DUF5666)
MALAFRKIVAALVIAGVAIGVSFGVGVAYGRGDPKTVDTGLTAQQIQSLLGVRGAQASGGVGTGSGATGSGGTGTTGGFGGGAFGGGGTTGAITAIDGDTITVQGFQGDVKVTLDSGTKVSVEQTGSASDLKVGDTVSVQGTTNADGSVKASSVSQLPAGLAAGRGGGGFQRGAGGAGGAGSASTTPTPTPTP